MLRQFLFLLTILFGLNLYSQISFEKGYYIDNTDQKVNCFIKNSDWKNNPTSFEYKLTLENEESNIANLKSIKEFGILNASKYIRKTVGIDRSSKEIKYLTTDKNPTFQNEQHFLNVLVEGEASLYYYEEGNLKKYFYNKSKDSIAPLIFKSYLSPDNKIGKNTRFRQQLWTNLKCNSVTLNDIKKLNYKRKSLINYFIHFNECNNHDYTIYEEKNERDLFNITVRPRINQTSLTINNDVTNSRDVDFGNKTGFSMGVEFEFILPYNKNKWAVAIEPTYQFFEEDKTTNADNLAGGKLISELDYSSIEIPISLRHYFFLNNEAKIFANISYIIDVNLNSSLEFKRADGSSLSLLDIESNSNLAFGVGCKINDKYSVEFRLQTNRNILSGYQLWNTDYQSLSFIIGYSIL